MYFLQIFVERSFGRRLNIRKHVVAAFTMACHTCNYSVTLPIPLIFAPHEASFSMILMGPFGACLIYNDDLKGPVQWLDLDSGYIEMFYPVESQPLESQYPFGKRCSFTSMDLRYSWWQGRKIDRTTPRAILWHCQDSDLGIGFLRWTDVVPQLYDYGAHATCMFVAGVVLISVCLPSRHLTVENGADEVTL